MLNESGYNRPILNFRDYMQKKYIDPYEHGWEILRWLKKNPDELDELGVNLHDLEQMHDDGDDLFYDILTNMVSRLTPDQAEKISQDISYHNPAEAPTWSHMDYNQLVRPGTWLVHFSDEAWKISQEGFNIGMEDMGKLGLTTHFSKRRKQETGIGGYNFAFKADSKYATHAARNGKYGEDAVMFRSAGVEAYHYGDQEDQVVFFGAAIDPGQIVLLTKLDDNEWCVAMQTGRRDCAYIGRGDWSQRTYGFDSAVDWVMNNFDQYRKRITNPHMKWRRQTWL